MNRREAIAALTAIPGLTRIEKADVKPDDVLVITCAGPISEDTARRIKTTFEQIFTQQKLLVLPDGMQLKVMSKT